MIEGHLSVRVSGFIVQSIVHWLADRQRSSRPPHTGERASLQSTLHLPVPHFTTMPLHDSSPSQTTVTSRAWEASSCISRHAVSEPQLITTSAAPAAKTPVLTQDSIALQSIVRSEVARTIDESHALGVEQATLQGWSAWHWRIDSRPTSSRIWHIRLHGSVPVHGPHCEFAFALHCKVVDRASSVMREILKSMTTGMLEG